MCITVLSAKFQLYKDVTIFVLILNFYVLCKHSDKIAVFTSTKIHTSELGLNAFLTVQCSYHSNYLSYSSFLGFSGK